ncbi:MAG TPA: peptidase M48, partial [Alphaproteobacteria bacterium]|nr:peptidase M48 [Alphaproteobacteria bacterium]
ELPVGRFLTAAWADGMALRQLERIDVNGYPAATGVVRMGTRAGPHDFRLLAIEIGPGRFARFIFITRPETTDRLAVPLQRATYSFRPITPAEASSFRPLRLEIVAIGPDDTVDSLARRMPFDDHRVERFLTLNGLDAFAPLEPGRRVKLVAR